MNYVRVWGFELKSLGCRVNGVGFGVVTGGL